MRRIVVTQNITLDGVIDNAESWFHVTADDEQGRQLAAITAEHAAASDGFLVGRTTFEEMRGAEARDSGPDSSGWIRHRAHWQHHPGAPPSAGPPCR